MSRARNDPSSLAELNYLHKLSTHLDIAAAALVGSALLKGPVFEMASPGDRTAAGVIAHDLA